MDICQQSDRISKLETNHSKRMLVISGLTTSSEDKNMAKRQIDKFIHEELAIPIRIEDFYEVGLARPKAKVVILTSSRDKNKIMRRKTWLRGKKNEHGKNYYINDFLPAPLNEKRRMERELIATNDRKRGDQRDEIEYVDGALAVNGEVYRCKISPPQPQAMLDISTEKLKQILKIPICRSSPNRKRRKSVHGVHHRGYLF